MSEKPRPLPVLMNGLQHGTKVYHFERDLVLRPAHLVTLECVELGIMGGGPDEASAKRDFAANVLR
jgi:hypothetical protein